MVAETLGAVTKDGSQWCDYEREWQTGSPCRTDTVRCTASDTWDERRSHCVECAPAMTERVL